MRCGYDGRRAATDRMIRQRATSALRVRRLYVNIPVQAPLIDDATLCIERISASGDRRAASRPSHLVDERARLRPR